MKRIICYAVLVSLLLVSNVAAETTRATIVRGESGLPGVGHAAEELQRDMQRVYGFTPEIVSYSDWSAEYGGGSAPADAAFIFVGILDNLPAVAAMLESGEIEQLSVPQGPEGFFVKSFSMGGAAALVISAQDQRGVLYGVYEYSRRVLGVDPYEYWTGKMPPHQDTFEIPDTNIEAAPPVFPLRGYFDNDNDMIANWKGEKLIIEFDTWKEMIDSLARLRYNYVDLHDTLGRAEFWNWSYYTSKFDYHADVELIDRIIDYVHSKGMLVQIPMYLGWEFYHMPIEKICLSKYHDDWMATYEHYLTKTPLGKADMFLQRPRDPWWDRAYVCPGEIKEGIPPGPLMTRMFNGLNALVKEHTDNGFVVCDLWSEGREMWRKNNFAPDKDIQMLWADGGYANYSEWPRDFKGHDFGIYVHAGYYLNHVMQDPYPARIKEATLEAVGRGMTANYFVNGQDFKHFILNMEATALAAWDPEAFDPEAFYLEWTGRYFGSDAAPTVVESLKQLHLASDGNRGFTKILDNTDWLINKLRVIGMEKIDMAPIDESLEHARKSLALAGQAAALVPPESELVYDDQILFPAKIYLENLKLYKATAETMNAFFDRHDDSLSKEQVLDAKKRLNMWKRRVPPQLEKLRAMLDEGSKWKKWDGWTACENFRKITPPPDPALVERIIRSLK